MTLENYLLGHIIEEKAIIEELLKIDNAIQNTNYTYAIFLNRIRNVKKLNLSLPEHCNVVTDGDPDTIYNILITSSFIKGIHINNCFVALNKWLVERAKEYYQVYNREVSLSLDVEKNYNKYIEEDTSIILYGFDEFVDGMAEIFSDKNIAIIKK